MERWPTKPIDPGLLNQWADDDLYGTWGLTAAARVLGIVTNGCDVEPLGDIKNKRPSEVRMRKAGRVLDLDGPADNLFGVSQALTWVAGRRAEIAENLHWRTQVHDLITRLDV